MFVLTYLNKMKERRYYHSLPSDLRILDCDSVNSACKFNSRQEAEEIRDKLNAICKLNKWYGKYHVAEC